MKRLIRELTRPGATPVFLTGAGISLPSGIPTFRTEDNSGLWNEDTLKYATYSFFKEDPVAQWQWYLERFSQAKLAKPNKAHYAITDIQRKIPKLSVITQNIDGLHIDAGTRNVIEIHGTARHYRCSNQNCPESNYSNLFHESLIDFTSFIDLPSLKTIPRCPYCQAIIRPHVLWFDESYDSHQAYDIWGAQDLFQQMTSCIFIGTSFSVGITDRAMHYAARNGTHTFIIDPAEISKMYQESSIFYKSKAEEFLPELVSHL